MGENSERSCISCGRLFTKTLSGIWRFGSETFGDAQPHFYQEAEWQRWLGIFRETESKDWVIYKNSVYRYISQAGHRIIAKKQETVVEPRFGKPGMCIPAMTSFDSCNTEQNPVLILITQVASLRNEVSVLHSNHCLNKRYCRICGLKIKLQKIGQTST